MKGKSRILCLILSLVFVFAIGFTACGGGGGDNTGSTGSSSKPSSSKPTSSSASSGDDDEFDFGGDDDKIVINFYGDGDDVEKRVFGDLVSQYNSEGHTYNEKTIAVNYNDVSSVSEAIASSLGSDYCPEVFYVGDGQYKQYVESGFLANLNEFVNGSNGIDYTEMWPSIYDRYYYSTTNHRAGKNADSNGAWYGMPKDIGPTVMYYNEDQLKAAGIRVISVAEEDLADFNDGKTFTRGTISYSKNNVPYIGEDSGVEIYGDVGVYGYFVDDEGQKFINNKIAMSWDEIVEVAKQIATAVRQTNSGFQGGYFTEWWFNYGWSVGGNCIQYVETSDAAYDGGFYDFTLVDDTKNFIVIADDGITVNGTKYAKGEIISYNDKLTNEEEIAGNSTDQLRASRAKYDSAIGYNNEANDAVICGGKLQVLPSQREAFCEFVRLSSKTSANIEGTCGYEVTPTPSSLGSDGAKSKEFLSGNINFLVDGRWNVTTFREQATFAWDVAPLPIYRTYENDDGNFSMDRTVKCQGVTAGHSGSVALAISATASAEKKAAAWDFVKFIAGEDGQIAQSKMGFAIPSQMAIAKNTTSGVFLNQKDDSGKLLMPYNAEVFIDAAMHEGEGDWAFLETGSKWIDKWASALNNEVRNGTMTFTAFVNDSKFTDTFDVIKKYTRADYNHKGDDTSTES